MIVNLMLKYLYVSHPFNIFTYFASSLHIFHKTSGGVETFFKKWHILKFTESVKKIKFACLRIKIDKAPKTMLIRSYIKHCINISLRNEYEWIEQLDNLTLLNIEKKKPISFNWSYGGRKVELKCTNGNKYISNLRFINSDL